MTAETNTAPSVDAIDTALATAAGTLGADEQQLAVAVLRLLAVGAPVSIGAAATAARLPRPRAEQVLRSWPAVFWDDHDRVTGFWGLALPGMPHPIRRAGTDLSAWCAWDPLFLARVIGDLQVATADPVDGEAITYRISGDGAVTGASHPAAVLSFLRPGQPWADDVMTTFCPYVLHFTTPAPAPPWTASPPPPFATPPPPPPALAP